MKFWKKQENLILTVLVILFFGGLAIFHDVCGECSGFFSFGKKENNENIQFMNDQNQLLTLNEFKGKPVIINFWATWCHVCINKMEGFNKFAEKFEAQGGKILAMSRDPGGINAVRSFFAKNGYKNLNIYLDSTGSLIQSFGARGLPTAILINADGQEIDRIEGGFDWESSDATDLVFDKFGLKI